MIKLYFLEKKIDKIWFGNQLEFKSSYESTKIIS